jgi:hypothetical protein
MYEYSSALMTAAAVGAHARINGATPRTQQLSLRHTEKLKLYIFVSVSAVHCQR